MKLSQIKVGKTYGIALFGKTSDPLKAKVTGIREVRSGGYAGPATRKVVAYEMLDDRSTKDVGTCPPAQVAFEWTDEHDAARQRKIDAATARKAFGRELEAALPLDEGRNAARRFEWNRPVSVSEDQVTIKLSRDEARRLLEDLRRANPPEPYRGIGSVLLDPKG